MFTIKINIPSQIMLVFKQDKLFKEYLVSTAKNGVGEVRDSECTPTGLHVIRAKIGEQQPINTVFVNRRPTGEIFSPDLRQQFPNRDWILTRILWLSGLERGKNRLGNVDTMRRYIYIHGTPDDVQLGVPGSRGCIRMANANILELFAQIPVGTRIFLQK